jgi:hypothetical protein
MNNQQISPINSNLNTTFAHMKNHAVVRRKGKPRQQNVSSDINTEYIFSSSVGATARCGL